MLLIGGFQLELTTFASLCQRLLQTAEKYHQVFQA